MKYLRKYYFLVARQPNIKMAGVRYGVKIFRAFPRTQLFKPYPVPSSNYIKYNRGYKIKAVDSSVTKKQTQESGRNLTCERSSIIDKPLQNAFWALKILIRKAEGVFDTFFNSDKLEMLRSAKNYSVLRSLSASSVGRRESIKDPSEWLVNVVKRRYSCGTGSNSSESGSRKDGKGGDESYSMEFFTTLSPVAKILEARHNFKAVKKKKLVDKCVVSLNSNRCDFQPSRANKICDLLHLQYPNNVNPVKVILKGVEPMDFPGLPLYCQRSGNFQHSISEPNLPSLKQYKGKKVESEKLHQIYVKDVPENSIEKYIPSPKEVMQSFSNAYLQKLETYTKEFEDNYYQPSWKTKEKLKEKYSANYSKAEVEIASKRESIPIQEPKRTQPCTIDSYDVMKSLTESSTREMKLQCIVQSLEIMKNLTDLKNEIFPSKIKQAGGLQVVKTLSQICVIEDKEAKEVKIDDVASLKPASIPEIKTSSIQEIVSVDQVGKEIKEQKVNKEIKDGEINRILDELQVKEELSEAIKSLKKSTSEPCISKGKTEEQVTKNGSDLTKQISITNKEGLPNLDLMKVFSKNVTKSHSEPVLKSTSLTSDLAGMFTRIYKVFHRLKNNVRETNEAISSTSGALKKSISSIFSPNITRMKVPEPKQIQSVFNLTNQIKDTFISRSGISTVEPKIESKVKFVSPELQANRNLSSTIFIEKIKENTGINFKLILQNFNVLKTLKFGRDVDTKKSLLQSIQDTAKLDKDTIIPIRKSIDTVKSTKDPPRKVTRDETKSDVKIQKLEPMPKIFEGPKDPRINEFKRFDTFTRNNFKETNELSLKPSLNYPVNMGRTKIKNKSSNPESVDYRHNYKIKMSKDELRIRALPSPPGLNSEKEHKVMETKKETPVIKEDVKHIEKSSDNVPKTEAEVKEKPRELDKLKDKINKEAWHIYKSKKIIEAMLKEKEEKVKTLQEVIVERKKKKQEVEDEVESNPEVIDMENQKKLIELKTLEKDYSESLLMFRNKYTENERIHKNEEMYINVKKTPEPKRITSRYIPPEEWKTRKSVIFSKMKVNQNEYKIDVKKSDQFNDIKELERALKSQMTGSTKDNYERIQNTYKKMNHIHNIIYGYENHPKTKPPVSRFPINVDNDKYPFRSSFERKPLTVPENYRSEPSYRNHSNRNILKDTTSRISRVTHRMTKYFHSDSSDSLQKNQIQMKQKLVRSGKMNLSNKENLFRRYSPDSTLFTKVILPAAGSLIRRSGSIAKAARSLTDLRPAKVAVKRAASLPNIVEDLVKLGKRGLDKLSYNRGVSSLDSKAIQSFGIQEKPNREASVNIPADKNYLFNILSKDRKYSNIKIETQGLKHRKET